MDQRRIALHLDEDAESLQHVATHLAPHGLVCVGASATREGLTMARYRRFDLIIAGPHLGGRRRLAVIRAIRTRSENRATPILLLAEAIEEMQIVAALDGGADDVLPAPFGARELAARVRALLRRPPDAARTPSFEVIECRGVRIDVQRRLVLVGSRSVMLTHNEFELLLLLATRRGVTLTREMIIAQLWPGRIVVPPRSVDSLIKRLRRKIEGDRRNPAIVTTVHRSGYRIPPV